MKNYKKDLTTSFVIVSIVLIISLRYINLSEEKEKIKEPEKQEATQQLTNLISEEYNYPKLLKLIEQHRQLSHKFATNYELFLSNTENVVLIENLLKKLTKEKYAFIQHMKSLKSYTNAPLSSRKKKALRHYCVVIEDSINELEDILEKFKKYTCNEKKPN